MKVSLNPNVSAFYPLRNVKNQSIGKQSDSVLLNAFQNKTQIKQHNFFSYSNISFKASLNEHLGQGARYLGEGKTRFRITAPYAQKVFVSVLEDGSENKKDKARKIELEKKGDVFEMVVNTTKPHDKYFYTIDKGDGYSRDIYDPRSDYLPFDVGGFQKLSDLSEIVDHKAFKWKDKNWMDKRASGNIGDIGWGLPNNLIIESMHIGLLGGFTEAKKELDNIALLGGANAVRVMPVGEFYGKINWGYDEVCKYSVENAYGTPDDFKDFVNHAHSKGIKVLLDVVPNHFGPNGGIVQEIMPTYAQDKETSWGKMLDFHGDKGQYMRSYMTDMLINWAVNYHVDGFRFDATQAMDADDALIDMIKELRSHEETKDLILYPEDMRMSRMMANSNLLKEVSDSNWGFNGITTFDFFKSLISNATNSVKQGWSPHMNSLEQVFKTPICKSHEEEILNNPFVHPDYRAKCVRNLSMPAQNANNMLVGFSNHDEISNAEAGKRNIVNLLYSRLGMNERCQGNWSNATSLTLRMLRDYAQDGKISGSNLQNAHMCTHHVTQSAFETELKNSFEINKLMLGTMFMHPSPKEFFMGDSKGELAPLKYFCEYPDKAVNPWTNRRYIDEIADEKGYFPGQDAFNESKLNQDEYSIDWIKQGTVDFFTDFANIFRTLDVFKTADLRKISTYSYPNERILEVKRFDDYGNEVIALMNFSPVGYQSFKINTSNSEKMLEVINSTSKKYKGDGKYANKGLTSYSNVKIPPYGIVVLQPQG